MIDFHRLDLSCKPQLDPLLRHVSERGCDYSFANLFLWGRMDCAVVDGDLMLFSNLQGRCMYPNPIAADRKTAVERIIADARQRGIPVRISNLTPADKDELESLYPGQFRFHCDRANFDYVYEIDALADLKGRKLQSKRTRIHRFEEAHPDAEVVVLTQAQLEDCRQFAEQWYADRLEEDPHADLHAERVALNRALKNYEALAMEGVGIYADGRMIAMSMGSFLDDNTVDVHFEKADARYVGSYAVINREFASHIRSRYPAVRFLNREDDVGSEGLRTAKLSYIPHHLVEKCWAHLRDADYDE